ncbi:hypothetical protein Aph01nite_29160 [Acrocarpospora phusangensis]|uniref:Uncharacterized protein n=1 Tax=Acrocarpospora phusangensis TaxID=1070424 RepID=A0A919QAS7_9ACTN|nr:hypothetical protein [Acrocarpospora phusangensis]GIH24606.1 hypothetical protein Aph01nite_29160 [Acrocarpospora phusangensis]
MSSELAESMDRQAARLRERLTYWAYVFGGMLAISTSFFIGVHEYDWTDSPQVDRDAVGVGILLTGIGLVLLLGGVVTRRRSQKSWIIPGLFFVIGLLRLVWLYGLPPR